MAKDDRLAAQGYSEELLTLFFLATALSILHTNLARAWRLD